MGESILGAFGYTRRMLAVAGSNNARRQDIKGVVSYQSLTRTFLAGTADKSTEVRLCLDEAPAVEAWADLRDVVPLLASHDVVLVVGGPEHRLQGIVTA